jgi:L-iditol 2-dehydrogenase
MPVPETMRALVLSGTGFEALALRPVPIPRPGPGQLLARVDAAGICTSLVKLIEQGPKHTYLYGWDVERYPLILGDEGAVTLVEIGDALRAHYRVGQRFVVQPSVDHAPINHRERYGDVERVHKLGVGYTLAGHLAEYMLIGEEILEAGCLLPLPDEAIPHAHAAMGEPLSCVVSGQDHHLRLAQEAPHVERTPQKGLKPGGVTVVVGAGAMGRMHVDLALSYRPCAVVVTDLIASRLERTRELFAARARELGVELVLVDSREQNVREALDRLSGHRGADDVIVAVGVRGAIEEAQRYCGRGAVLNLFGGLRRGEHLVALDGNLVHYQEIIVTSSSGGSPWDVARTLELLASGKLDAGKHIARIGDLAHAKALIEMVKRQELDGKAVVYPHRRCEEILKVDSWSAGDERQYLQEEAAV